MCALKVRNSHLPTEARSFKIKCELAYIELCDFEAVGGQRLHKQCQDRPWQLLRQALAAAKIDPGNCQGNIQDKYKS